MPIFRLLLASIAIFVLPASAQTIEDGFSVPTKSLYTQYLFNHDTWDTYWEGPLKRSNGNLGTVTTDSHTLLANYGLTSRVNVIATVPFVWTGTSQGVLAGMQGWQDITLAAKVRIVTKNLGRAGSLTAFGTGFWGTPVSSYISDFQPLSIGFGARRSGARATVHYSVRPGWFLDASAAYTWRGSVHLDRPYYFTNNTFYNTNIVDLPNVVDYSIGPGFCNGNRMAQFVFSKRITQGGGDIRRQDAPFISNRILYARVGAVFTYPVPRVPGLAFRLEYSHVIDGRNAGQATTISTGLTQIVSFKKRTEVNRN